MARTWSPATTSACCPRRSPASRCSPTTSSPCRCRSRPAPPRSASAFPVLDAVRRADLDRRSSSLIAFGNLRGVKESGKLFAVPTYFFIVNMACSCSGRGVPTGSSPALARQSTAPSAGHGARSAHAGRRAAHGRRALRRAARVRLRRRGGHRRRGHLERCARVQEAGVEERPHDPRDHGLAARRHVPRPVDPGRQDARRPFEKGTPTVISQIGKLVYGGGAVGHRSSTTAAGRHDADPRARGQHELRRLPPARQLPRRRQLHAPPAHQARPPARVLERHHLPRGRGDRARCSRPTPRSTGSSRSTRSACSRASRCRRRAWPSTTSARRSRAGAGACSSTAPARVLVLRRDDHHRAHQVHRRARGSIILLVPIMVFVLHAAEQAVRVARTTSSPHDVPPSRGAAPIRARRHVVIVFVDRLDLAVARASSTRARCAPDELPRRALRSRPDPTTEELIERGSSSACRRLAARHRRVPRPAHPACRAGAGVGDARRRATEVTVLLPAASTPLLAPAPARPHGGRDRRGARAAPARP